MWRCLECRTLLRNTDCRKAAMFSTRLGSAGESVSVQRMPYHRLSAVAYVDSDRLNPDLSKHRTTTAPAHVPSPQASPLDGQRQHPDSGVTSDHHNFKKSKQQVCTRMNACAFMQEQVLLSWDQTQCRQAQHERPSSPQQCKRHCRSMKLIVSACHSTAPGTAGPSARRQLQVKRPTTWQHKVANKRRSTPPQNRPLISFLDNWVSSAKPRYDQAHKAQQHCTVEHVNQSTHHPHPCKTHVVGNMQLPLVKQSYSNGTCSEALACIGPSMPTHSHICTHKKNQAHPLWRGGTNDDHP